MWSQAREPASPFSAGHQLTREYLGKHAWEAAHPSSMAGIPILSSNWGVMMEDLPLFHAWPMTPPPPQDLPAWRSCAYSSNTHLTKECLAGKSVPLFKDWLSGDQI